MAYDSATDTALAGQALQRALATAAQKRDSLNRQFGLNADGSLDNTPAGNLGTIYQTGLAGEHNEETAATADRSRGFAGTGGLAGKAQAQARRGALDSQAQALQGADLQLAGVNQDEQGAQQQYQGDLGTIGSKSAFDLAQTLAANPVSASPAATAFTPTTGSGYGGVAGSISPALALAQRKALAANPRAAQAAKNSF